MAYSGMLQRYEEQVITLMEERKFNDAYKICTSVLRKYPDQKNFVKFKNRIEEIAREENEKYINYKLIQINELKETGKIAQYLRELKSLTKISPDNRKLIALYNKEIKTYQKEISKAHSSFLHEKEKLLKNLYAKKPAEFLQELNNLERNNPRDEEIKLLIKRFRAQYIHDKIGEHRDLIVSDKYDDLRHLINDLKKIDSKNKEVAELETILKKRLQGEQLEQIREFVYDGETYLNTLMKLDKYDKALALCNEMLIFDPANSYARKILGIAQRKFNKQNAKATVRLIQKSLEAQRENYKRSPKSYVRIF